MDFWKVGLTLIGTIIAMNLVMNWAVQFGAVIGSLAAVGILLLGTVLCFHFIYQYLSKYDYRLIGEELILERALGRANHIIFTIDIDQINTVIPYDEFPQASKIKRLNRLVLHKDTSAWYVISYKKDDGTQNLVFEPDQNFLSGLNDSIGKVV